VKNAYKMSSTVRPHTWLWPAVVMLVYSGHLLPNHVVVSFKSRLDKFWQHQDVIYDFKAEIHGTGSRELLLDVSISISNCNIRCGHRGIGLCSSFHYVYVSDVVTQYMTAIFLVCQLFLSVIAVFCSDSCLSGQLLNCSLDSSVA